MPLTEEVQAAISAGVESNWIRTRRYTVTYIQENPDLGFAQSSATPFTIPVIGQMMEVNHRGIRLSGKVTKLQFHSDSFRDGTDYSTNEGMYVHLLGLGQMIRKAKKR